MYVEHGSGAHFTNDFSIIIKIWWKFHSALIQVEVKWLLQNFAHATTAVLSWHVQHFVAICLLHYNGVTLKQIFHQILITMEKLFVKRAPDFELTIDISYLTYEEEIWNLYCVLEVHGVFVAGILQKTKHAKMRWHDTKVKISSGVSHQLFSLLGVGLYPHRLCYQM